MHKTPGQVAHPVPDTGRRATGVPGTGSPLAAVVRMIAATVLLCPTAVLSADTSADPGSAAPGPGTPDSPVERVADEPPPNGVEVAVDRIHSGISDRLESTAKRVDAFFADDRYYADTTRTYVRLSALTTWESGEDNESRARLRARFDLPGTRQRLRLFVEGGDSEVGDDAASDSIPEALDDNDYNVGLEAQFGGTGAWDIRPGIGVKAASSPDPFVRLRATRYRRWEHWLGRFSAGVAEFVDDGTEARVRVDFDRGLTERWLFRSASRVRYRDSKDKVDFTQQLTLFQKLSDRLGLAYDAGLRADDDQEWEVNAYYTQARVRYRAYKKWLFLELTPEIVYREEDDYDPSFRLSLRADLVFGARYRALKALPPSIDPP